MEYLEQYRTASLAFLETCQGVEDWEAPALGEWSVRSLVGHTNRSHTNVTTYLEAGPEPGAGFVDGPVEYFATFWAPVDGDPSMGASAVAERGRLAGEALGADPLLVIERDRARALSALAAAHPDARLRSPAGTMTLDGYLPTRTFELAVHTVDLARATGLLAVPGTLEAVWPDVVRLAADLAVLRGHAVDVVMALTGRGSLPENFTVL
jgi:hypothetical protein